MTSKTKAAKPTQATAEGGTKATPNSIALFFHCAECIKSKPDNIAPRDWARLSIGWTKKGLQAWCVRHDRNVADIDLLGHKVSVEVR